MLCLMPPLIPASGPNLDDLAVAAMDNLGEGHCTGICQMRECEASDPTMRPPGCLINEEDDDITDCDEDPESQGIAHFLDASLIKFQENIGLGNTIC